MLSDDTRPDGNPIPILTIAEREPSMVIGWGAMLALRSVRPSPPTAAADHFPPATEAIPDKRSISDLINAFEVSAAEIANNAAIQVFEPHNPTCAPPSPKSARHRWRKQRSARG